MTAKNGKAWDIYNKLGHCYDRLAEALGNEESEPQAIMDLAAESEQLIAALAAEAQPEEAGEILPRLASLQRKTAALAVRLQEEREKAAQLLSELKKGRKALTAYISSPQEMEYTEGKFFDRKK